MKQQYFDSVYERSKSKGFSAEDSYKIALKSTEGIVHGKKSFAVSNNMVSGDNVLDVLVGYPEIDTEAQFGGRLLDPSGWNNVPDKSFTADIGHYTYDLANGVKNDLDDKWKNFRAKAQDWYYGDDGLRAKVYVPETELGKEFVNDYKQGKYGVSIEYVGNEHENIVHDWEITGLTFHDDPSYTKTKQNGKEKVN